MSDIGNASKDDLLAAEEAIAAEAQRAQNAEAVLVSGTNGLPSGGGSQGVALWSDAQGQPQYTDAKNGTRALALGTDVSALKSAISSASSTGYKLINKQVWTTGGTYTYTPTAGTTHIIVKLCGSGGGGGSARPYPGYPSVGLGAGGGTYAETPLLSVPSSPVMVTVGVGGQGGKPSGVDDSYFQTNIGSVGNDVAPVSVKYTFLEEMSGQSGSLSSFGDIITTPGGSPGIGYPIPANVSYLTNAALSVVSYPAVTPQPPSGTVSWGSNGVSGSPAVLNWYTKLIEGSSGGDSYMGRGGMPVTGSQVSPPNHLSLSLTSGNGFPGTGPGAGGSGAVSWSLIPAFAANAVGGNGTDGIVIVEEYA